MKEKSPTPRHKKGGAATNCAPGDKTAPGIKRKAASSVINKARNARRRKAKQAKPPISARLWLELLSLSLGLAQSSESVFALLLGLFYTPEITAMLPDPAVMAVIGLCPLLVGEKRTRRNVEFSLIVLPQLVWRIKRA